MMVDAVRGSSIEEAETLIQAFESLLSGEPATGDFERLGEVAVLAGVRRFPSRIKCALLPWGTLREALRSHESNSASGGSYGS
jgi:nitrogen fixation protein NifU and related proteins